MQNNVIGEGNLCVRQQARIKTFGRFQKHVVSNIYRTPKRQLSQSSIIDTYALMFYIKMISNDIYISFRQEHIMHNNSVILEMIDIVKKNVT